MLLDRADCDLGKECTTFYINIGHENEVELTLTNELSRLPAGDSLKCVSEQQM